MIVGNMKKITLITVFSCIIFSASRAQKIEIQFPFKKQKELEIAIPKTDKMDLYQIEKSTEVEMVDSIPLLLRDRLLLRHRSYYMMDPSAILADFERYRKEIETDSFYISPALWTPYTNQKYRNPMLENDLQVEYMHGEMYLVPKPDYSRGGGLFENRKSYREQRKLRMLKYITEEVYPVLQDSVQ